jgi:7-carboxy-7-deazaguanine synthase
MKETILYNVSEIFYSIQGESTYSGLPCVFVRMQGCNMRCSWCDTEYALEVKTIEKMMSIEEIISEIRKYNCNYICVTGGEPLMQKNISLLFPILFDNNFFVTLETNGHYLINDIDSRVIVIMDFKCPDSAMEKLNNFENINYLTKNDEVKFVISSRKDYEWAKKIILKYKLEKKVNAILMSTVFADLKHSELAKWILDDKLQVRLQLQLHKYIWDPQARGV